MYLGSKDRCPTSKQLVDVIENWEYWKRRQLGSIRVKLVA